MRAMKVNSLRAATNLAHKNADASVHSESLPQQATPETDYEWSGAAHIDAPMFKAE